MDLKEIFEASIKKWEDIAAGTGMDMGQENCSLCRIFFIIKRGPAVDTMGDIADNVINDFFLYCTECPVREITGMPNCLGTPYEFWMRLPVDIFYMAPHNGRNKMGVTILSFRDPVAATCIARHEIDFLKAVRDETLEDAK